MLHHVCPGQGREPGDTAAEEEAQDRSAHRPDQSRPPRATAAPAPTCRAVDVNEPFMNSSFMNRVVHEQGPGRGAAVNKRKQAQTNKRLCAS